MATSDEQLIDAALAVRTRAYGRYSGFRVGAALIDEQGQLHTGCNVENAAYPLGTCAEAGAIAAMVAAGGSRIVTIAVAGGKDEICSCTPCGGCRQRINEFADSATRVLAVDDSGQWQSYSVAELLPASFHL